MQPISFEQTLHSPLSPDRLFAALSEAFEDSAQADLWPDAGARLRALEKPLHEGGIVEASYGLGPLKSAVPYRLARLDPERRELRDAATGKHPLEGGATVRVEPEGAGARLTWKGAWTARRPWGLGALAWFKLWYEPMFFRAFARRLRAP